LIKTLNTFDDKFCFIRKQIVIYVISAKSE
jgi:hypothetical protein